MSSLLPPSGNKPCSAKLSNKPLSLSDWLMALLAAATTDAGVLAGAKNPNHSSTVSSGKPCSANVATSGTNGERDLPEPHLVLEIASVPEQSGQRYPGDPNWYTIGDPEYLVRHEEVMSSLMSVIDDVGATLVMFDSPYIRVGSLSGAKFADDARVDAWNALMESWMVRWPTIRRLDWSAIVEAAESTPGELRADGVHMEQVVLDRLVAESVVPRLREVLAERGMSPTTAP